MHITSSSDAFLTCSAATALHISGLCFAYPATPDRWLLNDLSAAVLPGVTLIKGGDGCGKTTLLRLLAGELVPCAGQVQWHSTAAANAPDSIFWVDPRATTHDALLVADYFEAQRRQFPGFSEALLVSLIAGFGLNAHLHKQLFMLSTGSRRKVFLAAALASGAALTLIDEPFAALDAPSIRCVSQALRNAAADPSRMCVMADYAAPADVPLSGVIDLGN